MNEKELTGKIHSSMYHQLQSRGYAAPVDVLIDTGILPKQKYEDWRFGHVRDLEAVCNANLKRLIISGPYTFSTEMNWEIGAISPWLLRTLTLFNDSRFLRDNGSDWIITRYILPKRLKLDAYKPP